MVRLRPVPPTPTPMLDPRTTVTRVRSSSISPITGRTIENRARKLLTPLFTGLDFLQKKTGYVQSRETNEKITDGARGLFEKATGFVLSFLSILPIPTPPRTLGLPMAPPSPSHYA
jgi:hypothetical protein